MSTGGGVRGTSYGVALGDAPPAWVDQLADWSAWLRAAGRPETTIYLRTYQVKRMAKAHRERPPYELSVDDLAAWLAAQEWAPETRRSYRAAFVSFYSWAQAVGRCRENIGKQLPTVTAPAGKPRPAPEDVLRAALAAAGMRERLMLLLAANVGLRRAEIARVHSEDVQRDYAGWALRVTGKGRRVRVVPLSTTVLVVLRAQPAGFAFPGDDRGHLSPAYVGKVISGLLPDGYTAHTLRHRFASMAYAGERDLRAVQELLGHAKPETTARYTAIPDGALRRAVEAAA